MRVLFTLLPATGSLQPLAPIAAALVQAGHQVAFCSSRSFRPDIEAVGFPALEAGLDWHGSDPQYIQILCQEAGLTFPPIVGKERYVWVVNHLFIGAAARRMVPDVIKLARDWAADLIVRESLEFSGCVAAEFLDLPHASVAAAADSALDLRSQVTMPLAHLRAQVGLPTDPDGHMAYRYLHLCFTPRRWDGPAATFPDSARFFRHANAVRPGETPPAWLDELTGRPVVLVSLGTVFHRTPGLYEHILEALRDEPIDLILAVGRDQDPTRFGPQPPNVRIERYLPLPHLLPRCALFVTHGGFNSTKEALSQGIPLVVVPIAGDQPYCAERCAALGVAQVIASDERTPERIRRAARAVFDDRGYRARAEAMSQEMRALPGLDQAVELLETLAAEHRSLSRRTATALSGTVP